MKKDFQDYQNAQFDLIEKKKKAVNHIITHTQFLITQFKARFHEYEKLKSSLATKEPATKKSIENAIKLLEKTAQEIQSELSLLNEWIGQANDINNVIQKLVEEIKSGNHPSIIQLNRIKEEFEKLKEQLNREIETLYRNFNTHEIEEYNRWLDDNDSRIKNLMHELESFKVEINSHKTNLDRLLTIPCNNRNERLVNEMNSISSKLQILIQRYNEKSNYYNKS